MKHPYIFRVFGASEPSKRVNSENLEEWFSSRLVLLIESQDYAPAGALCGTEMDQSGQRV